MQHPTPNPTTHLPRGGTRNGDGTGAPAGEARATGAALLGELVGRLPTDACGVEYVYWALDRVAVATGADDVVLVVRPPRLGTQLFRSGRAAVDTALPAAALAGEPGLYLVPEEGAARLPAPQRGLIGDRKSVV